MVNSILHTLDDVSNLKELSHDELRQLAEEIRHFLIQQVFKTGGHLASNLGVTELTLALHYCLNSPTDKIIWDVGHQTYVHKILTGRMEEFHTLRMLGGLSGFPKIAESEHDCFGTGHSSTAISAALGIARARDLNHETHHVVAVVGDGAFTGGMCYEAMNDAGHAKKPLIVILNNNEMSIAPNVGAIARYLTRLRLNPRYTGLKVQVKRIFESIPTVGKRLSARIEYTKNRIKYLFIPGVFFEELGFVYLGPVDGHDISKLIPAIKRAQKMKTPVLIHVVTKKGKGFSLAERAPEKYHGVAPFEVEVNGDAAHKAPTYSSQFGDTLCALADKDTRIVAITAAMPESTGLNDFSTHFPDRFFDVGIAEAHAVTMAAGLASQGFKPVFTVYSSFLQRAYDQILHDVCLQNLPVIFTIDRAGLVGQDGETHQGVYDIAFLRHIPNITIMAPAFPQELSMMLSWAIEQNTPIAIRYPKGTNSKINNVDTIPIELGRWLTIRDGKHAVIISTGCMLETALHAAKILSDENIDISVVHARFIKPLDTDLLSHIAQTNTHVFTLEDGAVTGGFGSAVAEFFVQNASQIPHMHHFGIPDSFIKQGKRAELLAICGLSAEKIAEKINESL